MTIQEILAFLTFAVVAAITPGPSNIMVTATAAAVGFWRGLPCLLGVCIGMAALIFCVALGLGRLLSFHPSIVPLMNWVGAGFLLWLSWKIATADVVNDVQKRRVVGFSDAAFFQLINPKSWIVSMSAVGAYFNLDSVGIVLHAATYALLFFVAAIPSLLVWLLFGSFLERRLSEPSTARAFNLAMGLLLAVSTICILA